MSLSYASGIDASHRNLGYNYHMCISYVLNVIITILLFLVRCKASLVLSLCTPASLQLLEDRAWVRHHHSFIYARAGAQILLSPSKYGQLLLL